MLSDTNYIMVDRSTICQIWFFWDFFCHLTGQTYLPCTICHLSLPPKKNFWGVERKVIKNKRNKWTRYDAINKGISFTGGLKQLVLSYQSHSSCPLSRSQFHTKGSIGNLTCAICFHHCCDFHCLYCSPPIALWQKGEYIIVVECFLIVTSSTAQLRNMVKRSA